MIILETTRSGKTSPQSGRSPAQWRDTSCLHRPRFYLLSWLPTSPCPPRFSPDHSACLPARLAPRLTTYAPVRLPAPSQGPSWIHVAPWFARPHSILDSFCPPKLPPGPGATPHQQTVKVDFCRFDLELPSFCNFNFLLLSLLSCW